jgi:two-component system response regulator YesN
MTEQNKKKILLVDDDNFLLEMYAKKFDNNGYDTSVCESSSKCLDILKEGFVPDILITDIIMPEMDGVELLKKIKEENLIPEATKIVLTNQGQEDDIEKVKEFGIKGYIVKALNTPSEVVEKVGEIYKK